MELVIGWPQALYLATTTFGLFVIATNHGRPREYDIWSALIGQGLCYLLLYWGGFFGH